MATALAPNKKYTFSITKLPSAAGPRKTLERLMRMEPGVAKGLRKLQARRKRVDNKDHIRGGRVWISKVRSAKLVHLAPGQSFTLHVTPQLLPDVQSIEKYLEAKPAK